MTMKWRNTGQNMYCYKQIVLSKSVALLTSKSLCAFWFYYQVQGRRIRKNVSVIELEVFSYNSMSGVILLEVNGNAQV